MHFLEVLQRPQQCLVCWELCCLRHSGLTGRFCVCPGPFFLKDGTGPAPHHQHDYLERVTSSHTAEVGGYGEKCNLTDARNGCSRAQNSDLTSEALTRQGPWPALSRPPPRSQASPRLLLVHHPGGPTYLCPAWSSHLQTSLY